MLPDLFVSAAEVLSLAAVVLSFIIFAYLSARSKTIRSLQFQVFIFSLILTVSEVPRIAGSLGLVDVALIETPGLIVHTVSMIALAGFLAYRVSQFRRRGRDS